MRIESAAHTDVGQKRSTNEDSHLIDDEIGLYVVCDGMGGHAAGEVASRTVCETLHGAIRRRLKQISAAAQGSREDRAHVLDLLNDAVQLANSTVHQMAEKNSAQRGMGTTMTLLLVIDSRGYIAHVGDSRLYLLRNEQVHQITADHTILGEMIRAGRIKEGEKPKRRGMNALTRAVGVYPNVEVDTLEIDLLPNDKYLLCSDGLHNYFKKFDLGNFLQHVDRQDSARELVRFANKCGGSDNITAINLFVKDSEETRQTLQVRLTINTLRTLPIFQYLSFAELLKVIRACKLVEHKKGELIIDEGQHGDVLYVILDGRVRVHRQGQTLVTLGQGRHVGEMSLIDNQPRSASVTCEEDCLLIEIDRESFYGLLREDSVMAVKLLWNFIQTLTSVIRTSNKAKPDANADTDLPLKGPYR